MALSADALALGYEEHTSGLIQQEPTANDNINTTAALITDLQDDASATATDVSGKADKSGVNGTFATLTSITIVNGVVTAYVP